MLDVQTSGLARYLIVFVGNFKIRKTRREFVSGSEPPVLKQAAQIPECSKVIL
ncbi:hypothetical protein [Ruegeria lacuscaerulensis]|uniref:hypothetical protein n=1 Tax=Ruegeria lacuscaerulensis TaxID=55218 RepID=UPI00147E2512|nr:hypothetical protein [Ruegeria lacuscaerulensis]